MSQQQVAVVTGGSGGIGQAVIAELRRRGYDARSWSRHDGVDCGEEDAVERAVAALPRWDVLVLGAAVLIPGALTETTLRDWNETLRAGLTSAFLCSRAALRRMESGGRIVLVSSLSGWMGAEKFPGMAAYVAAKAGLTGFGEALAVEAKPRGIRVNTVSLGSVRTPMLEVAGAPPDPAFDPNQVAPVIGWLASEASAPLSGANLRVEP
ncbi:MAG TPA: SDR family oxidoreductase [Candidatus Dormibacteraeota bacterium]